MTTPSSSGRGERDIDAAFEDIVARWDDLPAEPDRPAGTVPPAHVETGRHEVPARGEAVVDPGRAAGPAPRGGHVPGRQPSGIVVPRMPAEGAPQEHFGFRSYSPAEAPEETYEPPAPAPLPAPEKDPVFWAIIGCLVLGPAIMLLLVLTGRSSMTLLMTLAAVATAVGFGLLVMRGGRTPRDPGDDGARV